MIDWVVGWLVSWLIDWMMGAWMDGCVNGWVHWSIDEVEDEDAPNTVPIDLKPKLLPLLMVSDSMIRAPTASVSKQNTSKCLGLRYLYGLWHQTLTWDLLHCYTFYTGSGPPCKRYNGPDSDVVGRWRHRHMSWSTHSTPTRTTSRSVRRSVRHIAGINRDQLQYAAQYDT